ncbi:MAG TPA: energy transducer TonB, partial [Candidatus Bacteroides pullicola]|nr:energy transducer TonB [Candidatus Bacteroides pullicola]
MEVKKSPEADLERHRATRLVIGFMVALSIVFIALEWTSPVKEADMDWELPDLVFEEELDIPFTEPPVETPPPPPLAPPAQPEQLTLSDDDLLMEETPAPLSEIVDNDVASAPLPPRT